jgi:transposase
MRSCRSTPRFSLQIDHEGGLVRFIGLDVHRDFCEVAICLPGERARSAGRVATDPEKLKLFAESLDPGDRVVMESTSNALAIARVLEGHVAEVVLANPMQVRAISHAKVKNDRFDARTLAELFQAGVLPTVWIGDEQTRRLRRLTSRRSQLVRQRTRSKNEISAVLVRNLAGRPPASDPFGKRGRAWLSALPLPDDERLTVEACLRQIDFLGEEIAAVDGHLAESALDSSEIRRLMTIPGVDVTTAVTLMAAIGDIARFPSDRQLVGYLGLDARVRQSGLTPARHGRISKQGSSAARHVLVEAAWGSDQDTRAAACVLSAHQSPPWRADRSGCRRPQARRALLAAAHQAGGLRVQAPVARRPEAPKDRTPRRSTEAQHLPPRCHPRP